MLVVFITITENKSNNYYYDMHFYCFFQRKIIIRTEFAFHIVFIIIIWPDIDIWYWYIDISSCFFNDFVFISRSQSQILFSIIFFIIPIYFNAVMYKVWYNLHRFCTIWSYISNVEITIFNFNLMFNFDNF